MEPQNTEHADAARQYRVATEASEEARRAVRAHSKIRSEAVRRLRATLTYGQTATLLGISRSLVQKLEKRP